MRAPASLVAGVDGGGTGSRATVLDLQGTVLGYAEGEPALVDPAHPLRAARVIAAVVDEAVRAAGASLPVEALWAGLAGAGHPRARQDVEDALHSMEISGVVRVGMDVEAAHHDAFGSGPGVLLVVGTGSMAFGRDSEGRSVRVGGWGSLLGEEGSGYWIGLKGLQAVLRAADGREGETGLSALLPESLCLEDPHDLVSWAGAASKGAIAALAPLVLEAADRGDTVASSVREMALRELRLLTERAFQALGPDGMGVPVALSGGLVAPDSPFRELVVEEIQAAGGHALGKTIVPERGAAHLALLLTSDALE